MTRTIQKVTPSGSMAGGRSQAASGGAAGVIGWFGSVAVTGSGRGGPGRGAGGRRVAVTPRSPGRRREGVVCCPRGSGARTRAPGSGRDSATASDEAWNPKQRLTLSQRIDFINQQRNQDVTQDGFCRGAGCCAWVAAASIFSLRRAASGGVVPGAG